MAQSPESNVDRKKFTKTLEKLKQDLNQKNETLSTQANKNSNIIQDSSNRGLYGPEDKIWEIARESAAFFGGGRAVFLQLAHPYVASGVKHHSKAADDLQVIKHTKKTHPLNRFTKIKNPEEIL